MTQWNGCLLLLDLNKTDVVKGYFPFGTKLRKAVVKNLSPRQDEKNYERGTPMRFLILMLSLMGAEAGLPQKSQKGLNFTRQTAAVNAPAAPTLLAPLNDEVENFKRKNPNFSTLSSITSPVSNKFLPSYTGKVNFTARAQVNNPKPNQTYTIGQNSLSTSSYPNSIPSFDATYYVMPSITDLDSSPHLVVLYQRPSAIRNFTNLGIIVAFDGSLFTNTDFIYFCVQGDQVTDINAQTSASKLLFKRRIDSPFIQGGEAATNDNPNGKKMVFFFNVPLSGGANRLKIFSTLQDPSTVFQKKS